MNNDRTSNSLKNSISSLVSNCIAILVGFIAQAIFIRILGAEYLGLNGLFTNVLTMLGLFELGIGNAIIYNMYKPISENNTEKIKSLMLFYKKSYNLIACTVFLIGMLIMPFITIIVGTITIDINIYIIYFLFLLSTIVSYLMVYKRNMLYACQQNYIINLIHCGYLLLLNISQLSILFITKNYYLYLVIKIFCQLLESVIINFICIKKYPFLLEKNIEKIDKTTEKSIFAKVRALIFHKIGYIVINGTDNIIISKFLGVAMVGLYSNYYTVINALTTLFGQTITSITASIGNLIITADKDKIFETFKRIRFINFWISCFTATTLLLIMQYFIVIWVGKEYLLTNFVLVTLTFNYFQKMQRSTYSAFKDSAGIWEEDRVVPIIESVLNIVFSIICLKLFGLAGVFIGTIISGLALWCYSYPKFVYKKLFDRKYINYIKETLGYIILFILIAFITYLVTTLFIFDNILMNLITRLVICLIIPNLIIFILFRKTDNYLYFKDILKKIFKKIIK